MRFFMRIHVHSFFTEFYGICIYEEILYDSACFPCLRHFTEFVSMKRFFMRMHVSLFNGGIDSAYFGFLRNCTEFASMKSFFMKMHVFLFFCGILLNLHL